MRYVIAIIATALVGCSTSIQGTPEAAPKPAISVTDQIAAQTKLTFQQKLDTDPNLAPYKLTVSKVTVVNTTGNSYKGLATVVTHFGIEHDVSIDITTDNNHTIWNVGKDALAFVNDEPLPAGDAGHATPLKVAPDGWTYVITKSTKTRCQLSAEYVECEVQFDPQKYIQGVNVTGVHFTAGGTLTWVKGSLGGMPFTQMDYGFYTACGWTINATVDGTDFTSASGNHAFVNTDGVTTG